MESLVAAGLGPITITDALLQQVSSFLGAARELCGVVLLQGQEGRNYLLYLARQ